MRKNMINRKTINVILIGNAEEKIKFYKECYASCFTLNYFNNPFGSCSAEYSEGKYNYTITCIGSHNTPDDNIMLINNANAVIYLNASPDEISETEKMRCQNYTTIAIDFKSINLTALDCLKKIKGLQQYFISHIDAKFNEKISLISSATFFDAGSIFSCLPKDILFHELYSKYECIASNKFIFFSCPKALTEKHENKMNGMQLNM